MKSNNDVIWMPILEKKNYLWTKLNLSGWNCLWKSQVLLYLRLLHLIWQVHKYISKYFLIAADSPDTQDWYTVCSSGCRPRLLCRVQGSTFMFVHMKWKSCRSILPTIIIWCSLIMKGVRDSPPQTCVNLQHKSMMEPLLGK